MGIFDKTGILFDRWFNKDNFGELTAGIEKFNLQQRQNRFKVIQFMFTAQRKFKMSYIFKPPTVFNLEKKQFFGKNLGKTYLIDMVNSKKDLNVGFLYGLSNIY